MKATTTRHYHIRKVRSGLTPVRTHPMRYKIYQFPDKTTTPMVDYPEAYGNKYDVQYEWMSPDEYLYRVGRQQVYQALNEATRSRNNEYWDFLWSIKDNREKLIDWQEKMLSSKTIDALVRSMKRKGITSIPYISYAEEGQEGRHLAEAFKRLGLTKIPVAIERKWETQKRRVGT